MIVGFLIPRLFITTPLGTMSNLLGKLMTSFFAGLEFLEANALLERTVEPDPPAPTVNGIKLPPGFWANAAQNPNTLSAQNETWTRAAAEIMKSGTLMNSMRYVPLQREPTVMHRKKRSKHHWPWTGMDFSRFISAKRSDYTALLAQATGELLDADNACNHC